MRMRPVINMFPREFATTPYLPYHLGEALFYFFFHFLLYLFFFLPKGRGKLFREREKKKEVVVVDVSSSDIFFLGGYLKGLANAGIRREKVPHKMWGIGRMSSARAHPHPGHIIAQKNIYLREGWLLPHNSSRNVSAAVCVFGPANIF